MRLACVLMLLLALAGPARACSTPVFRYALERWRPAPYPLHVTHRAPRSDADRALLERLNTGHPSNLTLHLAEGAAPQIALRLPEQDEKAPPFWSGPLTAAAIDAMRTSPAREELARLLTSGESAVWLLLTSGDRRADEAALALLRRELARLAKELVLPDRTDDEASRLLSDVPLRLSFRILVIDRRAAGEALLVRSLLAAWPGLEAAPGPTVFPVVGRGRVLAALHGERLTAARVEYWASFLCGACSCRVKELNPGFDLLTTFDWDDRLKTPPPREELHASSPAPITIPPGSAEGSAAAPARRARSRWWPAGLAAWGAVVAAAAVWAWRRGAPRSV